MTNGTRVHSSSRKACHVCKTISSGNERVFPFYFKNDETIHACLVINLPMTPHVLLNNSSYQSWEQFLKQGHSIPKKQLF